MYTLAPRFIMSIRKLYVREGQGRYVGKVDNGLGLSSFARPCVGRITRPMVSADDRLDEGTEDVVKISRDVWTVHLEQ